MPGATAAGSPSKYITAALADLFSCIGAGDIVSAKALLEGKHKNDKEAILSATNPAGITVLQHACHAGQAAGVNMLLQKVRVCVCVVEERCVWLHAIPRTPHHHYLYFYVRR